MKTLFTNSIQKTFSKSILVGATALGLFTFSSQFNDQAHADSNPYDRYQAEINSALSQGKSVVKQDYNKAKSSKAGKAIKQNYQEFKSSKMAKQLKSDEKKAQKKAKSVKHKFGKTDTGKAVNKELNKAKNFFKSEKQKYNS